MPASIWTHERMISTTTAVLAGSLLFSTGAFASWTGASVVGLLMAGVEEDVRARRLPNRLTGFGLGAALLHAAWTAGIGGLLTALAGAAAGLAVLGVPFALRWLGAGDVKAAIALGALLGAESLASVLTWSTLFAGGIAFVLLATQGGLADLLRRWTASFLQSLALRRPCYLGPAAGSPAASGLPFGVALALGIAAHQTWGSTWTL